jgi:hypothetical protein
MKALSNTETLLKYNSCDLVVFAKFTIILFASIPLKLCYKPTLNKRLHYGRLAYKYWSRTKVFVNEKHFFIAALVKAI